MTLKLVEEERLCQMKSRGGMIDRSRGNADTIGGAFQFTDKPLDHEPEDALEKEFEFYLANKEKLLAKHEGEHMVIYGNEILGFAPTFHEGLELGVKRCGARARFLVHEVLEVEPIEYL